MNDRPPSATPPETKLWGGRFRDSVDPEIHRFTASLPFDRRLARADLLGSLAHARMLLEQGIVDPPAAGPILDGLAGILAELESGRLAVDGADEDVHSWIERQLAERIGEAAGRLHTARSRNDQTGLALRLYTRERLAGLVRLAATLAEDLAARAGDHLETFLPGYTHQQRGQPVSLSHHLLAHAWSLLADARRFRTAHETAGVSPLGAGALAGSPHPVSPARVAELLGLPGVFANSLHAVADRDYAAEAAFACALCLVHLSRWASEVVLWTSSEVGFARLSDRVAKGSSLMPQKKNPEPAEILRGKSGRVLGDLQALLVVLKGLPLAYNSDLQEDKEALFDALDTAEGCLTVSRPLLAGLAFDVTRMGQALTGGYLTATALADLLVGAGVPFREAHGRAGRVVLAAEERNCELWELPESVLGELCPELPAGARERLLPEAAARSHRSPGGPAPERVVEQLAAAREAIAAELAWVDGLPEPPLRRALRDGTITADRLA
ncbi:MAG: argininosuccinate lyase [Holophagales bacterium]|nr:MAG: argininosuccinate lyase [Holophagales bacterium]